MPSVARIEELLTERKRRKVATQYVPHIPTTKQSIFLGLTCREALFGGAAGGGKSDALLMDALSQVHKSGYSALLFRLTFTDLKLPGALIDRAQEWLGHTNAHWNGTEHKWSFPTGAKIQFGYMGNSSEDSYKIPTRYKSSEFQFIGFDEQTTFTEPQFRWMFNRMRRARGSDIVLKMRGATNPGDIGHDWVQQRYELPERPDMTKVHIGPKGRTFVPSLLTDNQHIDHESYLQSLGELDQITQWQMRDGLWIKDASKLVYRYDKTRNLIDELPRGQGDPTFLLSIDYGSESATAFVVTCFYPYDPNLYVVFSEKHEQLSPSDAAERVEELQALFGEFESIIGDLGGLGSGYAREARTHYALPIEAAKKSDKIGYIKLLNGDLEHGKVLILGQHCADLTTELGSLLWADDKKLKEKSGMANHCTDALLYGWRKSRHWLATNKIRVFRAGSTEDYQQQVEARFDKKLAAAKRRSQESDRIYGRRRV